MSDLWRLSATDLAARIAARQVSAREVASDALARLEAVNPAINAVVTHDPKAALAAADAVDAALARGEAPGPLAGVPVTVKINTDLAGWPTTNGLQLQKALVAKQDNPVVGNLRRAGAVILGQTNTPAFSLRWFTRNALHGATKNPRNPAITPGGSSGGAAAAVAAGIGAFAHGTDIAGSIRYPAYACGIHGLRPTLGRVPAWNATQADGYIGRQLMAVSGPIGRSIADLKLGLAAMAARDARDPWWVPAPLEGPGFEKRAALAIAPEGMPVVPEVAAALRDAAKRLEAAGWVVEEVAPPPLEECARLQAMLWLGETRHAGTGVIEREGDPDAIAVFGFMEKLCPAVDARSLQDALQRRLGLLREWLGFLDRYPVLLLPVSGELPFPDHDDVTGFARFERMMAANLPMIAPALLGLPGLTVSTGMVGQVPVGVQLLGSRYREDILLAAGAVIEAGGAPPAPIDPA